ncbi:PhzF family phenazine biosynthesis protein [Lactobacillus sp. YT155]|uniref:PhzF family phenazine biosynthesis protein n=1 Tax=Lactobacillus sp. YT155 TaxID=3060955 RepID=UPI00265DEF1F|nr:PhzF family phenazine biosynthesis protein [Lactobacillus sp. YT155]MDO1605097.1 PhzF family phenazine biosynthesis protein [Lactobacillus sp. YT155]
MREFHYELIDVFTKEPFGGNQLAVFEDAAGLTDVEMQKITRELNLSEAVFVTKITDQRATIRIFTPSREVPIAGHPTIGTGYIFAFSSETIDTQATIHSRMFGPTMGISEDPATGAASGPLGAYLTRYKLVAPQSSGEYQILSEQGMEINRPSQITINVKYNDEKISFVSIAGPSADVGRGVILLD